MLGLITIGRGKLLSKYGHIIGSINGYIVAMFYPQLLPCNFDKVKSFADCSILIETHHDWRCTSLMSLENTPVMKGEDQ